MSHQTLRELAREYAKGIIDKDNYRRLRAELINAIIAGEIVTVDADYPPPLVAPSDEDETTENVKKDRAGLNVSDKKHASESRNTTNLIKSLLIKKPTLVFTIASIIFVVSLIIAVILFYPEPPNSY